MPELLQYLAHCGKFEIGSSTETSSGDFNHGTTAIWRADEKHFGPLIIVIVAGADRAWKDHIAKPADNGLDRGRCVGPVGAASDHRIEQACPGEGIGDRRNREQTAGDDAHEVEGRNDRVADNPAEIDVAYPVARSQDVEQDFGVAGSPRSEGRFERRRRGAQLMTEWMSAVDNSGRLRPPQRTAGMSHTQPLWLSSSYHSRIHSCFSRI